MNRIAFILLCLGLALTSCAEPLRVNFKSADITRNSEGTMLAGFAARTKLSEGLHTPLKAGCVVFTDGQKKVCLVSMDMMEISPALADELRDSIQARTGIGKDNIILHCIHTHSAPRVGGKWIEEGAPNREFYFSFKESIIDLASETILDDKGFRRFKVESGFCRHNISHNRCEEGGPIDYDVYALRLLGRWGKPICAFFNIACHPVTKGAGNCSVGADYSGVARQIISGKWGCEVFQISGGQGNMDPAKGPQTAIEYCEECGKSLADSLSTIEFKPFPMDGKLELATTVAKLPYRLPVVTMKDIHAFADSMKVEYATAFPRFAKDVEGWEEQMEEKLGPDAAVTSQDYNMTGLNVGGLLFVFSQGEPFCEYQQSVRAAFPGKTVIFAGYTNGQSLYVASQRAFDVRKGYEYELEQDCVYSKVPYPMSDKMPAVFLDGLVSVLKEVSK